MAAMARTTFEIPAGRLGVVSTGRTRAVKLAVMIVDKW